MIIKSYFKVVVALLYLSNLICFLLKTVTDIRGNSQSVEFGISTFVQPFSGICAARENLINKLKFKK